MCKCTPGIRTPFCGKPGCEWPTQQWPSANRFVLPVEVKAPPDWHLSLVTEPGKPPCFQLAPRHDGHYARVIRAARDACSKMGCYCETDPPDRSCCMCLLSGLVSDEALAEATR